MSLIDLIDYLKKKFSNLEFRDFEEIIESKQESVEVLKIIKKSTLCLKIQRIFERIFKNEFSKNWNQKIVIVTLDKKTSNVNIYRTVFFDSDDYIVINEIIAFAEKSGINNCAVIDNPQISSFSH